MGDNVPGKVPFKSLDINEDALQLNYSQRGVSVIKLDGNLVGELLP